MSTQAPPNTAAHEGNDYSTLTTDNEFVESYDNIITLGATKHDPDIALMQLSRLRGALLLYVLPMIVDEMSQENEDETTALITRIAQAVNFNSF